MDRLTDKVCFVTGAAQGIGRSIVDAFLREGATVIAADLNADKLSAIPQHPKLRTTGLDATDEAAVARAAAAHSDVSVLVNCVGYVANGTLLDCSLADFERSLRINVTSAFLMTSAFLPNMLSRNAGSIINIASVVSSVRAAPQRFAYATSKAALIGLTMSVARDFVGQGIRCNAISPGTVETPSLHDRMSASGDFEQARQSFIARQPMGRLGTPDEIAAAAVMLASNEAPFMTGANIIIDGGMSL